MRSCIVSAARFYSCCERGARIPKPHRRRRHEGYHVLVQQRTVTFITTSIYCLHRRASTASTLLLHVRLFGGQPAVQAHRVVHHLRPRRVVDSTRPVQGNTAASVPHIALEKVRVTRPIQVTHRRSDCVEQANTSMRIDLASRRDHHAPLGHPAPLEMSMA